MKTKSWLKGLLVAVAFGIVLASAGDIRAELTIGSKAPAIDIEHWLSDGGGHFKPVKDFEKGKVYVVEFWATWCGPCIHSMPHIVQVQKEYLDKGVQFISVSDEDLETVETFLERKVPKNIAGSLNHDAGGEDESEESDKDSEKADADEELTFSKLTSSYCLTTDPDESVKREYFEAAGEMGIPSAFIVGKTGEVEWIGHPMEMDEPLAAVVAGKWDRDAAIKKREEEKLAQAEMVKVQTELAEVFTLAQKKDYEAALKRLDEISAEIKDPQLQTQLGYMRLQIQMRGKPEDVQKALSSALETVDDAELLNAAAWSIVERMATAGGEEGEEIPESLIDLAYKVAEKGAKLEPENGGILDTLAHLAAAQGDIVKAIELQTKAVKLMPDNEELKVYLEELKESQE